MQKHELLDAFVSLALLQIYHLFLLDTFASLVTEFIIIKSILFDLNRFVSIVSITTLMNIKFPIRYRYSSLRSSITKVSYRYT